MLQKAHYRLNIKVKDDKFSIDDIAQYNLSLQVSFDFLRICITDTAQNRCLLIEDYQIGFVRETSQLIDQLNLIFEDHHLLRAGFWKTIKVSMKGKGFSLIPNSLFDKEQARKYLEINTDVQPDENIYYYKHRSTEAVNIFAAEKKLVEWFAQIYPNKKLEFVHHTSPFIEGAIINNPNEQTNVHIDVESGYFTVVVKTGNNLQLCNTFQFQSTDDFVYFTAYIFEQLKLSQEKTPITLWGEITHNSPICAKLAKYIRNVFFGKKPSSLKFSYHFDELLDHRFFDLYSMHFCD